MSSWAWAHVVTGLALAVAWWLWLRWVHRGRRG